MQKKSLRSLSLGTLSFLKDEILDRLIITIGFAILLFIGIIHPRYAEKLGKLFVGE